MIWQTAPVHYGSKLHLCFTNTRGPEAQVNIKFKVLKILSHPMPSQFLLHIPSQSISGSNPNISDQSPASPCDIPHFSPGLTIDPMPRPPRPKPSSQARAHNWNTQDCAHDALFNRRENQQHLFCKFAKEISSCLQHWINALKYMPPPLCPRLAC